MTRQDGQKFLLSGHQRSGSEIPASEEEQIEGEIPRHFAMLHYVGKDRSTEMIRDNELAIEYRVLGRHFFDEPFLEFTLAGVTVQNNGQLPEAVMFGLENPIRIVERIGPLDQGHRQCQNIKKSLNRTGRSSGQGWRPLMSRSAEHSSWEGPAFRGIPF